jgi:hypothetical protein
MADITLVTNVAFSTDISDSGERIIHSLISDTGHILIESITDIGEVVHVVGESADFTHVIQIYTYLHHRLKRIKA